MLHKVTIINAKTSKETVIYLDSKNFNFNHNKCYDLNYNHIDISVALFNEIVTSIKSGLLLGTTTFKDGEREIKVGEMVDTPDFLINEN